VNNAVDLVNLIYLLFVVVVVVFEVKVVKSMTRAFLAELKENITNGICDAAFGGLQTVYKISGILDL